MIQDPSQTVEGRVSVATELRILSPWFRLLIPSVADLIFIVLLIALTGGGLAGRLLKDAGTGWHIRNGQQILLTHSITRTDTFSYTMQGQTWYAWEWLYDVLIAAIYQWLGLNGVVFFTAVVIAATFALVLRLALHRGSSLPVAVILLMLAVGASIIHFFARPHVLSWLLTVIWFQLLDSSETTLETAAHVKQDRRLLWLPVIMLLWTNLHGGFLLGIALCGLYLIAGLIRYFSDRKDRQTIGRWLKRLAVATLFSLFATLVNPYGYKLHVHIYLYLSNRFLMNHIDEFLSPNFHGVAQQCFAALLLITVAAVATKRQKLSLSHLLLIIFAAYSGLYASRNLPVSSILLTLIVAPILSASTALALILGLVVCIQHGRLGARQVMDAHFDAKRFPVQAAEVIAQRGIEEPIFAPDYWGGYLIYRFFPKARVFVDDRHDLYGDRFLKDYLKVVQVQPDWEKFLNERKVDCVLAPTAGSLANILKETPTWNLIYEDSTAVLFQKIK
ncbi:MAG: hypothetical protein AUI17_01985 [Acidobacteriales bacterium 13_2_20CM_2_55_5]|nr:MAG: hypothetical protein AUI17_01985 [Acidobacteriales bacterium 13_2_20CM_2_55_5]